MHIRVLYVLPWCDSSCLFSTEEYVIVWMDHSLSIFPLKDILVASNVCSILIALFLMAFPTGHSVPVFYSPGIPGAHHGSLLMAKAFRDKTEDIPGLVVL